MTDKEQQENHPRNPHTFFQSPPVRALVGSAVSYGVTPLLMASNQVMAGEYNGIVPMFKRGPMKGSIENACRAWFAYCASFTARMGLDSVFPPTPAWTLWSAAVAGGIAGFVSTPLEALAQAKQLSILSSRNILIQIIHKNGPAALFRGASVTVVREALWTVSYMGVPEALSEWCQERGASSTYAEPMSAFFSGAIIGALTTPFARARVLMQKGIEHESKEALTIREVFQSMQANKGLSGLFFGWKPRSVQVATTAAAITSSLSLWDHYTNTTAPDMPDTPSPCR